MLEHPLFWLIVIVIVLLIVNISYLILSDYVQSQNFTAVFETLRAHRAGNAEQMEDLRNEIDSIAYKMDDITSYVKPKQKLHYNDEYPLD